MLLSFLSINILAATLAVNNQGYIELGAGYMPLKHEPEITLENPVAYWAIGKDYDSFGVKLDHYSGVFDTERGTGLTSITVYKRFDF